MELANPIEWAESHKPLAIVGAIGSAVGLALILRARNKITGAATGATAGPATADTSSPSYAATTDGTVLSWSSPGSGYGLGQSPVSGVPLTTSTAPDLGLPAALPSQATAAPVAPTQPWSFPSPGLPGEKIVKTVADASGKGAYALTNYGGVYTAGDAQIGQGGGSYLGLGPSGQMGDAGPGTAAGRQFNDIQAGPNGYTEIDTAGESYNFATAAQHA